MADTGRPETTPEEKENIVRKLEPYLKIGLSIRKACLQANVPKSTVYDLIKIDEDFSDKITTLQNHMSVLVSDILMADVVRISTQVKKNGVLLKDDAARIQWIALNSNLLKEEFAERKNIEVVDPEAEIRRINALIDSKVDALTTSTPTQN